MKQNTQHETPTTRMADVANKPVTMRRALAGGRILVGAEAFDAIRRCELPKGDALAMAQIAGIQAAKLTPQLLPLCHPLPLNRVIVHCVPHPVDHSIEVFCLAEVAERTGVEMEALCGLSMALLTIWDLAKPINPALEISGARLLFKSGGKRGEWRHPDGLPPEAEAFLDEL